MSGHLVGPLITQPMILFFVLCFVERHGEWFADNVVANVLFIDAIP